jgi:hypothetical protein
MEIEEPENAEQSENAERWHAWRTACEHGWDDAEAYDVCLHPDTRIPLDRVLSAVRVEDAGPVSAGAYPSHGS